MGNVNKFNPSVEVKQRLRALYQKDNWHWLLAVLADVAVIVLAVYFADR